MELEKAPTIFELNDSGLKLLRGKQVLMDSPGFAQVSDKQLLVGKEARRQARLHPLQTHNQFWQRLDTEPLNSKNPKCRHHADLVFEHLQAIKKNHNDVHDIVMALPAHYTNKQLSLLLGIAQHCHFNVIGLVDTAVASLAAQVTQGRHCFIDLQLHRALINQIDVDDKVSSTRIEAVPGAGLAACQDMWANLIAEQFIQQTRFNPMHKAETEQQLYNQLHTVLQRCQQQGETIFELAGHRVNISLQLLEDKTVTLLEKILNRTGNYSGQLFISERCYSLPGFSQVFPQAISVSSQDIADNIHLHQEAIIGAPESLQLISSLPANQRALKTPQRKSATHLLWQHQAIPVGAMLYIANKPDQALNATSGPSDVCRIKPKQGNLEISDIKADSLQINGQDASEGQQLIPGDQIKVASLPHSFTVINVVDKHGA